MAKPLQINRDLVKALFLKGVAPSEIALQFGVTPNQVRVWASRGKWVAERESLSPTQAIALQDVAAEFANRTIAIARRLVTKLEELPVATLRDTKDCSAALATTYATARKALGLDDNADVQRHLHVHMMKSSSPRVASTTDLAVIDAQVVDDTPAVADAPAKQQ